MKSIYIAAVIGVVSVPCAYAQNVLMLNNGVSPLAPTLNNAFVDRTFSLRSGPASRAQAVTVTFNMPISVAGAASTSEWTGAMTSATETLFGIINAQCELLTKSLKGTCRPTHLQSSTNSAALVNPGNPTVTVNATATFVIEPNPVVPVAAPSPASPAPPTPTPAPSAGAPAAKAP